MKSTLKHLYRILTLLVVFSLIVFTSCKEDEPQPRFKDDTADKKIIAWIESEMKLWYYWNTSLPGSPNRNLGPTDFFESLLHQEDRFSWIQDDYEALLKSLQGITKEAGFEFLLYRESEHNNNVFARVLYIKPHSPAAQTDLKRGDIITHVNGTQINLDNYRDLVAELSENHSITYKPLDVEEQKLGDAKTISLTPVEYAENPNYVGMVIEADDRKIGYYVYNFFATGTSQSPQAYSQEMDDIFATFKSAGITDLVLDLRYNNGGTETAAIDLASYIGVGVDNTKLFAKKKYNAVIEAAILNDPSLGADFLNMKFSSKSNNIGNLLTDQRVYILTSARTASASELIISGLKPYMDVFLIGDVTTGKNVGSISLQDDDNPDNKWGMQPIVVKVFNKDDQSDYSNGFAPNVVSKEGFEMYPLGDPRETLLAAAIAQITGSATIGRASQQETREVIAHSLDFKPRRSELIIDTNIPQINR